MSVSVSMCVSVCVWECVCVGHGSLFHIVLNESIQVPTTFILPLHLEDTPENPCMMQLTDEESTLLLSDNTILPLLVVSLQPYNSFVNRKTSLKPTQPSPLAWIINQFWTLHLSLFFQPKDLPRTWHLGRKVRGVRAWRFNLWVSSVSLVLWANRPSGNCPCFINVCAYDFCKYL